MTPLDPTYGPTFRARDRLAGDDLTEWSEVPLFALARHFRLVHREFGVARGLRVDVAPAPTGWSATVGAGLAYDALGRPLQVWEARMLTIARASRPTRGGVSHRIVLRAPGPNYGPLGVPIPAPGPADVRLVPAEEPASEWDVPLAALRWPEGGSGPVADPACRVTAARMFRRPFVAGGTLPSGTTAIPLCDEATPTGWSVWVDTRSAGFLPGAATVGPVFVVRVGRPTVDDAARLAAGVTALAGPGDAILQKAAARRGPRVSVSQSSADGFTLTVRYDQPQSGLAGLAATPLDVNWVGVEADAGGPVPGVTARPSGTGLEGDFVGATTDELAFRWPAFQDGRLLSAEALNDLQDTVQHLQWLHNRSLHDWGVAQGCGVTALEDGRGVRVAPGYALDRDGREVIVPAAFEMAVPATLPRGGPTTRTLWVTASYRESVAPRAADTSCRMEGVPIRRLPEAVVRWRDPEGDAPRPGLDVILATVTIDLGKVVEVAGRGRRSAVPGTRPHVAAGRHPVTPTNAAAWQVKGTQAGRQVQVDTTSGGFANVPAYLVTLETENGDGNTGDLPYQPIVVAASANSFSVVLPDGPAARGNMSAKVVRWARQSVIDALGTAYRTLLYLLGAAFIAAAVFSLAAFGAWALSRLGLGTLEANRRAGVGGTLLLFLLVWFVTHVFDLRRERRQTPAWLRTPAVESWKWLWGQRVAILALVGGGTAGTSEWADKQWPELKLWNDALFDVLKSSQSLWWLGRVFGEKWWVPILGENWWEPMYGEHGERLLPVLGACAVGLLPAAWDAVKGLYWMVRNTVAAWKQSWGALRRRVCNGGKARGRAKKNAAETRLVIAWVGIEV